ncbi:MAG: S4 domain-containing protein [Candidatus Pacearchaeota archaeon]
MHLKRLAIPKSWPLPKKVVKFVVVPKGKALSTSMALAVFLRDILKEVKTFKEAKKVIKEGSIEVNGKVVKDEKFALTIFDRIFIKKLGKYFTIYLNKKGKIEVKEIDKEKYPYKPCKIIGKTALSKGRTQLNLYDGWNLIVEKNDFEVGDTIVIRVKDKKIEKVLPLTKNAKVFIIKGKNVGKIGRVLEIGEKVKIKFENEIKEIPKENLFVIDENEPDERN